MTEGYFYPLEFGKIFLDKVGSLHYPKVKIIDDVLFDIFQLDFATTEYIPFFKVVYIMYNLANEHIFFCIHDVKFFYTLS